MYKWSLYTKKADFYGLSERFALDPVICRVMINRGVLPEEFSDFLHPSKDMLHDEKLLADLPEGVQILKEAILARKKIRVIGDYDIDGVCATHILKQGILRCGGLADSVIPHRVEDGYGINHNLIDNAISDGIDLIITCDNGISAADVIERAKQKGLLVIVTDHHSVPTDASGAQVLPPADAVINPHRTDCAYPFKNLCGAVVAWKFIFGLYDAFCIDRREAFEFIEFAAFASVGDIMPLTGENRSIVSLGLQKFSHTKNVGLRSLIRLLELEGKPINAYHLGFVLGPCINASGRLDTAEKALLLLEETDPQKACDLASELIRLNEERKELTHAGFNQAIETVEKEGHHHDSVLVVYVPQLHESICGIVAGRLRERYSRPSFILTKSENRIKGSGRSIEAYPMFEKLQECKELLERFGGHPKAAGLTLEEQYIDSLRQKLNENAKLSESDLVDKLMIDAAMPFDYITKELVRQLNVLEPFGEANEKPLFAQRRVGLKKVELIGRQRTFLKFMIPLSNGTIEALFFGDADAFREDIETEYGADEWNALAEGKSNAILLDVAYYPQINEYYGMEQLQVVIKQYRVCSKSEE